MDSISIIGVLGFHQRRNLNNNVFLKFTKMNTVARHIGDRLIIPMVFLMTILLLFLNMQDLASQQTWGLPLLLQEVRTL